MKKTISKRNVLSHIKRKILFQLFKMSTKNSLKIFFRGKDSISIGPQIDGIYEEGLTKLINNFAEE